MAFEVTLNLVSNANGFCNTRSIDDHAIKGEPWRSDFYVVFAMSLCAFTLKTIFNKFAISNLTALILGVHTLRCYLKLNCEYELHSLANKKVSAAKDHSKNYIKVRPLLVHYILPHRIL